METKELIRNIHRQWLAAKTERAARCAGCGMEGTARLLEECKMFSGSESAEELMRLFISPQGLEFCLAAGFPSLATIRLFKPLNPERLGIYIDAGQITLDDPGRAVLIGRTNATVRCSTLARHEVTAMHGATAAVIASGWAVVHTQSGVGSSVVRRASGNAVIL